MDDRQHDAPVIVVGLLPDQPAWVLQVAGEYARTFGARLVIVTVDSSRYTFEELPDGTFLSAPIQPPIVERDAEIAPERLEEIGALLDPVGVGWSACRLVGEAAAALMQVADEENALMFVVGTRRGGLGGAVIRFFTGSLAVRLSHRQWRPVVVVPVEPTEPEKRLPWEEREHSDR
jgi:nucleotide-binding universal stress UspA family protein